MKKIFSINNLRTASVATLISFATLFTACNKATYLDVDLNQTKLCI